MAIEERISKPIDDFPETTWLRVRILPDDIPRAIRMRRFLKAALRSYGIKAMELTPTEPIGALNANGARKTDGKIV